MRVALLVKAEETVLKFYNVTVTPILLRDLNAGLRQSSKLIEQK
jgi:hypothetical protein